MAYRRVSGMTAAQAQGDLFGFVGRALKGAVRGATSVGRHLPGPFSLPSKIIHGITNRPQRPMPVAPPGMQMPQSRATRGASRAAAGLPPKRRRMNYGNVKALKRADRRIDGFVKVAKNALKHTNYKVVSRSAGTRRKPMVIKESGPGNVVVRD